MTLGYIAAAALHHPVTIAKPCGFRAEGVRRLDGEGSRGFPLAHCIGLRAMLKCALVDSRTPDCPHVQEAFLKRHAWEKPLGRDCATL